MHHGSHGHRADKDSSEVLQQVLVSCIGAQAREIFVGDKGIRKLLHINDYSLDKTFVYAIMVLSTILSYSFWPCGVFGTWPPEPHPVLPNTSVLATDNVEPRDRVSASSSSSVQPS